MIVLAYVGAAFGLKGFVKLKVHTESLASIVQYDPLYLIKGDTVLKTRIVSHFIKNNTIYVQFENITDRNQADNLTFFSVGIDKNQLPQLAAGEFYWHDLLNYQVVNINNHCLGTFVALSNASTTDIMVVRTATKDILIPFVPQIYVKSINTDQQQIIVDWNPDWM